MRRTLLASLLLAVVPAAPAAAGDAADLRFLRGCEFDTVAQDTVTGGRYAGVLYAKVVAYSVRPEQYPVTVTSIGCELRVNGHTVLRSGTWPGAGPVGVVPPEPIEFAAGDTDWVELCTLVDVVDGEGDAHHLTRCPGATTLPMPPPWMADLVDDAFTLADAAACERFVAAAPYLPPPVTVGPDGDVYVGGELWWDCPPYV